MNNFIFTCGDINGIGPEISIKAINELYSIEKYKITLVIPKNVFEFYKEQIPIEFPYNICNSITKEDISDSKVSILDIGKSELNIGSVTANSGLSSFNAIIKAFELIKTQFGSAIITAPVSKEAWQKGGIKFTGHTELLASLTNVSNYAMMFLSKRFKAVLTTIHIPISSVSSNLSITKIKNTIMQAHNTFEYDLKIKSPRIAVLGLNPHAGENGQLGAEEIDLIIPAIKELQEKGINVTGPFVPDAFFGAKLHNKFDVTVGMYHDQVLIPFKLLNFDEGVNYTSGLPIIRTSPDHGTAFDIARKLVANPNSIIESFNWAREIVKNRNCSFNK
ncbi:MAG: 4-hydroxythreonine-4-phosphate dehydrogenase PdxA [Bacteroidetes bacterium]|nr:4-hydroxythreonine-4-phosphate dehydrogenase PdxA [Bacteroidota bacterium]MBU1115641.1 4-hydroxythreonine-4-phosphate dehydrogenase PdxA [Bacteroidota bacterium]MBU1800348.1 4-hydroxythreonine-4-phosphate dehydrogenase PdxA [Bacteroidota bacterium]